MLTIFGGRIADLEYILINEQIPEGWESRIRKKMGLTGTSLDIMAFRIEFGVNEKKYKAKIDASAPRTAIIDTGGKA